MRVCSILYWELGSTTLGRCKKDPNDYDPCTPNSHHEDEEVSSDEDVDEWLNAELEAEERDSSETLLCQLPPKEMNPGSFTLPCTIGNLKLYVMADLGTSVNLMPKSLFKYSKLADLKETNMMVGMAFIDMLEGQMKPSFWIKHFCTIHAQIDVFRREILLGIGEEKVKFDMNGGICHSRVPFEKIYMASFVQKSEYFNPLEIENDVFSYDSPACLLLEQSTTPCSDESIDTVDSSDDMQELKGSQEDEKDCGNWPTCNPDLRFCSRYDAIYGKEESGMLKQWICFPDHERQNVGGNGMIFADFLKVRYGNKNIDDVTRKRRYYEWVAQNYDFNAKSRKVTKYAEPYDFHYEYPHPYIPQESDSLPNDTLHINTYFPDVFQTQLKKPRLRDNSFEEWVKIKLGHTNISETIKCKMFKEWVKENFNFKVDFRRTHDDPYFRRTHDDHTQTWVDVPIRSNKHTNTR
ncbi:hypothetical protein Tco_0723678 [Tanacetum coccineum]